MVILQIVPYQTWHYKGQTWHYKGRARIMLSVTWSFAVFFQILVLILIFLVKLPIAARAGIKIVTHKPDETNCFTQQGLRCAVAEGCSRIVITNIR